MTSTITATDLARNLPDILNRVRRNGESFVVERNGEPVASLSPVETAPGITVSEFIARLGDLAPPGDGFAEDVEAVQTTQPPAEGLRWPS